MDVNPWDVVTLAFPFTEGIGDKERPAVVLSEPPYNDLGFVIVAMITSARFEAWPWDVPIQDLDRAGLTRPCVVRINLLTADAVRILAVSGSLAPPDRKKVLAALRATVVSSPA